jgi:hypothetical protein
MKNTYRHLLIYPTVLLTCLSLSAEVAMSQSNLPNRSRTTGADRPRQSRSRPANNSSESSSPSPSTTESPTTTTTESPAGNADIGKPTSTPASSLLKEDSLSFATFLPWISGFFHALELAGIGGLFYLFKRTKHEGVVRERKLAERVAFLDKSFKDQDVSVRNLDTSLSAVRKQAAQMQGVQQQQARDLPRPQGYVSVSVAQAEYAAAAPVASSEYPFLALYKQSPESFKSQYNPTVVSENKENLQKRWGGDQNEIILETDRRGNYWLFSEGSKTYLIPNPKLNIIDANMRTVGSIFDCVNYSLDYRSFSIVKPAIVSLHVSAAEQQWKLETKGSLEFS